MDLDYFADKDEKERLLLRQLRATRAGFAEERLMHNFLLDSYVGCGGFQNGLIPSPDAPFWGRRAYERGRSRWLETRSLLMMPPKKKGESDPAAQSTLSYLVAFHGEDTDSYFDRIKTSAYHNPVEKIVRVTSSLLFQNDAQRTHIPQDLINWLPNVDRRMRDMNHLCRNVALRGQIFGWGATLVDMPKIQTGSYAESVDQGLLPYCIPLCPQEILDWDMRPDGTLAAVKITTMHEHPRLSLFDLKLWEEHFLLIYPDRWERYVVLMPPADSGVNIDDAEAGRLYYQEKGPNFFGGVPLSFFAWDEGLGGISSFGLPQIFSVAKAAFDLFNQNSELRRLMRDQTFATLVTPAAKGGVKGNLPLGTGNFITEKSEDRGITRFIAPPGHTTGAYEKRMEATSETLHQMAGIDSGSKKAGSETAEAMRIRFQQTEAMLFNAATNLENFELGLLRFSGRAMHLQDSALRRMEVYRQKTFDVARFAQQLDEAIKGMNIPWGVEVLGAIMKRTVRSLLPNAGERDLALYDAEIEKTAAEYHDRVLNKALGGEKPQTPAPAPEQPPQPQNQSQGAALP